jgi:delta 1-pyrroline-5-carboxylate dehydrogenase
VPDINPMEWTPRELRHSFVSVLSDAGVPLEEISRLVGHAGTTVTELVYRHQLKPVIQTGATVMDRLFGPETESVVTHLAHVPQSARPFRAENGRWPSGNAAVPMVLLSRFKLSGRPVVRA